MAKKVKDNLPSVKIKALDGKAKSEGRINAVIANVRNHSKSLHNEVKLGASLIVLHAIFYRDVTAATRLVDAMGEGMRKNDMRKWFIEFGPFTWGDTKGKDKDGKAIKGFKLNAAKRDEMAAGLTDAKSVRDLGSYLQKNNMWTWAKTPEFKPFDLVKVIEQALTRGDKRLAEKDARDNVVGIEVFKAALAKVKAEQAKADAEKAEKAA